METPTKQCSQCSLDKTIDHFGCQDHEHGIYRTSCLECDANAESLFGIENDYEARRAARLFRKYGMTPAAEADLLNEQNGCCASCGNRPDDKRLVVDYCKETHAVRGLLCPTCHSTVNRIGMDYTVMQRALEYLRSSRAA